LYVTFFIWILTSIAYPEDKLSLGTLNIRWVNSKSAFRSKIDLDFKTGLPKTRDLVGSKFYNCSSFVLPGWFSFSDSGKTGRKDCSEFLTKTSVDVVLTEDVRIFEYAPHLLNSSIMFFKLCLVHRCCSLSDWFSDWFQLCIVFLLLCAYDYRYVWMLSHWLLSTFELTWNQ